MWRWVDHTGELELEIEAERPEGLFAEATAAIAELLSQDERRAVPSAVRTVEVVAPDRAALLAAFVEELVFLAESESLVPLALTRVELDDDDVRAEVVLGLDDPPHLVKAVTYHRLEFARAGVGYRARVVLDV